MKYFTKEWYGLVTRMDYTSGLKVIPDKIYSDKEIQTFYDSDLAEMIEMMVKGEISSKQAKTVFEEIMKGKDPKVVVEEKGMKQVSDPSAILALVTQVLDANPQAIEDFKNGKSRAVGALVGQIMKLSKGQANPKLTNQILNEELKKR